ncbi:hypothetical protein DER45DRAFT_73872 [Fusarium avenaceum]|nr:hypothetical protein DER45DRAFT_73872 [Fusarium avenaceum]
MGKRLLMGTFMIMTPRSGVIMTALLPQALLGGQILGLSVYLHWLYRAMRSTVVVEHRAFAFVRGVGTPGTRKQEASHMGVKLHCILADHLLCMFYWHGAMFCNIFAEQIAAAIQAGKNRLRSLPTLIAPMLPPETS